MFGAIGRHALEYAAPALTVRRGIAWRDDLGTRWWRGAARSRPRQVRNREAATSLPWLLGMPPWG